MAVIDPDDTFFAEDRAAWREWLAAHHQDQTLVWLLLHKKHVQEPSVGYDEAVEEALCWGWIDGLVNRWDERSFALRFTPRKPGSVWSEGNVARVERLVADGRMTPAGMALVDEAKRRGTWDHAASGRRVPRREDQPSRCSRTAVTRRGRTSPPGPFQKTSAI